jgi:hypothetical protein
MLAHPIFDPLCPNNGLITPNQGGDAATAITCCDEPLDPSGCSCKPIRDGNPHGAPVIWWYVERGETKIRCSAPGSGV